MYCKNCGKEYTNGMVSCPNCGTPSGAGSQFCPSCGIQTPPNTNVCTRCGTQLRQGQYQQGQNVNINVTPGPIPPVYDPLMQKSKVAAGLLGIFLGALGVHNFYLGYTTKAVVQIILSIVGGLFTCGIATVAVEIWGLVEGILILTGSINVDGRGIPLRD